MRAICGASAEKFKDSQWNHKFLPKFITIVSFKSHTIDTSLIFRYLQINRFILELKIDNLCVFFILFIDLCIVLMKKDFLFFMWSRLFANFSVKRASWAMKVGESQITDPIISSADYCVFGRFARRSPIAVKSTDCRFYYGM